MRKLYFWSMMLQNSNWDGDIGGICNCDATSTCCWNGPAFVSDFTVASSVLVTLYGVFAWNSKAFVRRRKKKKKRGLRREDHDC
jgi:hypothetical protein